MQIRRDRIWRIGLVIGGLVALLILAASLSTPTLDTGWTATDFWGTNQATGPSDRGLQVSKLVIAASLILILTLLIANTLLASRRQRPLSRVNYSAIIMLLTLMVIAILRPDVFQRLQLSLPPAAPSAATPAPAASAPPVPAVLPDALVYIVSLAAAGLVAMLAWAAWRALRRPKPADHAAVARQAAQAAQAALADWQSGSPLASVIIRCYREMSELVAEKRAVERAADMTPREFVSRLEKAGVPAQPARQLTTLFELARYSPLPLGAPEEAAARACLKALAEALETGA